MAELPTGTVTFVFTDIEGSTRLERTLRERYREVLAAHQRLLRDVFATYGGHELDTQGDSFFYVFPRANAAVTAAVEAQRALRAYDWPEGGEVRVRIGVGTGEAAIEDRRYVGFAVHRAARISAVGHGGQILLASSTRELVEHDLPADQAIHDLGERRLKDMPRPERIFQLIAAGLQDDFPPLRTLDEEQLAEARRDALVARRYRRRAVLAIPAALAIGAALLAAALVLTRSSAGVDVAPNSLALIEPGSNELVDSVAVGVRPVAIAIGRPFVWVANADDETLSRIDPETRSVRTIPLQGTPTGIAVGLGSVWVAQGVLGSVARVDPSPGVSAVVETIEDIAAESGAGAIAVGEGAVWVAFADGTAARIDAASGQFRATSAGVNPRAIVVAESSVWVANAGESTVVRLDPRTLGEVRSVSVGLSPRSLALGAGALWVAAEGDDVVTRVDTTTFATRTIPVGDAPTGIAFGSGSVWVANSGDGTVSRIDPAQGRVVATVEVGHRPEAVAADDDAVWVSVRARSAT